jgi:ribosomal protein S18 acetylase RimI-like enzyme
VLNHGPVVLIREVAPGDWEALRDIRLAALREAPSAFGSTYAREAAFTGAQWRARISDRAATYLAYLPDLTEPAGIGGVYVEDDGSAELVSMWVRPAARGRSVGEALVEAAAGWSRARDHDALYLWVTESNDPARRLYERCGFTPTGERQPLPSDPAFSEVRMSRAL